MWETEDKEIHGRKVKVFKGLHNSLRDFWESTKVSLSCRKVAPAVRGRIDTSAQRRSSVNIQVFGAREYIIYEQERITYSQAHEQVKIYANLLHRRGIRKGDRVAILMRNIPEWLLAFWACHSIGAVVVAVNAWSSLDSILHCITRSEAKLLFVDEERMQVLQDSVQELKKGGCDTNLVARAGKKPPSGFEDLNEALKGSETSVPSVEIGPDVSSVSLLPFFM
jgi:acyl-coenzyme A synthetase/AMP-(fatty) acid ligase